MSRTKPMTTYMTVCRVVDGEDVEINVNITGRVWPPEPDVGIFSWYGEADDAKTDDGVDVELSRAEWQRANEALEEAHAQGVTDYYKRVPGVDD